MIKAVFFDFDETLQDRTAAFERYMDGFFARFFPGVTGEELEEKKQQMRQSGNGGYVDRVEWYKGLIALGTGRTPLRQKRWRNIMTAPSATAA